MYVRRRPYLKCNTFTYDPILNLKIDSQHKIMHINFFLELSKLKYKPILKSLFK